MISTSVVRSEKDLGPLVLALVFLCVLGGAISWSPVLAATLSVGFLAAPHNFMEVSYVLGRLPGRLGKLKRYFYISVAGIAVLGLTSLALSFFPEIILYRLWNAALIAWVAILGMLRRNEHPRRDWPWLEPAALVLIGAMWAWPRLFTLALVLGHPVMALIILGRELYAFRRPELKVYLKVMVAVPVGLGVLLLSLYQQGQLENYAIRSFFSLAPGSQVLLAVHTYLELLHYAVWIGILPWLASATRRGKLSLYPVLKKSVKRLIAARVFLLMGVVVTALFWWGFSLDFTLTRDFYFRLAIFHVLVEFPFLFRLL